MERFFSIFYEIIYKSKQCKLKGLGNPLASCFLISLDFLPPHKAHFDENIFSSFIGLYNFWVFTFCIFPTLQTIRLILQKSLFNVMLIADQLTEFYQPYLAGLLLLALC